MLSRSFIAGILLSTCALLTQRATAQLPAVGPTNPDNGFPTWYQDSTGQQLDLCLLNTGLCMLPAAVQLLNPAQPFPLNYGGTFPSEGFYWAGNATMPTNNGGSALLVMALFATFANGSVLPGDQVTFGRMRIRLDNLVAGQTYTITTPYGVFHQVAAASGQRGINFTQDIGGPDFTTALGSGVNPFLSWDTDLPITDALGNAFIGNPNIPHTVTGSPGANNLFRVDGPGVGGPGVNTISTNLFAVMGFVSPERVPPVANFTSSVTAGAAPLSVTFTDTSTGAFTVSSWDFGDGSISSVPNPTHIYTTIGSYTVSHTVSGVAGSDTHTVPNMISVLGPPVAGFTASVTTGAAPLSVTFTDASTGVVATGSWDFGDGSGSSVANPTHVYTTIGSYTVSHTVTGAGGSDTRTVPNMITVLVPVVASFTASVTSGQAPLSVTFTDSSTGAVTSRSWTFGDQTTSTVANPTHVYTAAGSFAVSLTVTGPAGSNTHTVPGMITVTPPPPVAAFTASPTSGLPALHVHFTNTSTGTISSRSWDFGDGGHATVANPNHIYSVPGIYTVSLTVTGPGGANTHTAPGMITVVGPVLANFTASVTSGTAPLSVTFTDTSTGPVLSRSWDFGDGGVATLANPTHVYTVPGTYTVSYTVNGPAGSNTRSIPQMISVLPGALLLQVPAPGTAGVLNTVTVTGVTNNAIVHLLGSPRLASQLVRSGASRSLSTLVSPILVAKSKAVGTTATFRFVVDPSLRNTVYHLQVVDTARGEVSNIVTHTY